MKPILFAWIILATVISFRVEAQTNQDRKNSLSKTLNRPRLSKVLVRNTVRIEAQTAKGSSIGTGFFYLFTPTATSLVPAIVTCRHVIEGATNGSILFANLGEDKKTRTESRQTVFYPDFEKRWIKHPDGKTDLAILPIAGTMDQLKSNGFIMDLKTFSDNDLPLPEELTNASVFTTIKMIGYPIGIWDSKNDLPVVRTGTTATDLAIDYEGEPKFLIDMAVFPGSSGSPIVFAEEGTASYGTSYMIVPDKLRLLGIVSQVCIFPASGGVQIVPVPTSFDMTAHVGMPANLGIVIKSEKLHEFEALLH